MQIMLQRVTGELRINPLRVILFYGTVLTTILSMVIHNDLLIGVAIAFSTAFFWNIFDDDYWKENPRAVRYVFTLPLFLILPVTSFMSAYLITKDLNMGLKFMYCFVAVYCAKILIFIIIINLRAIHKGYKKQWYAARRKRWNAPQSFSRDDLAMVQKKIESHLNKMKNASGYAALVLSLPGFLYKAYELIKASFDDATNDVTQTVTNASQTASKSLGTSQFFLFIFVFSLLAMTLYRSRIDDFLYEVKFTNEFDTKDK